MPLLTRRNDIYENVSYRICVAQNLIQDKEKLFMSLCPRAFQLSSKWIFRFLNVRILGIISKWYFIEWKRSFESHASRLQIWDVSRYCWTALRFFASCMSTVHYLYISTDLLQQPFNARRFTQFISCTFRQIVMIYELIQTKFSTSRQNHSKL